MAMVFGEDFARVLDSTFAGEPPARLWDEHDDDSSEPDHGVPTSGRKSNRHTLFSLLYTYVLEEAARLVRDVGRPGHASEYEARSESVLNAVRKHCFDGSSFTDSTADIADYGAYSQHCQVFAVISGAAAIEDRTRILQESRTNSRFSKRSYFMQSYALRAYAIAGDETYSKIWSTICDPWRKMLANNMTTWEEGDVRQRSGCHVWGSVPIYEYCTELAGIKPIAAGCSEMFFKPRIRLSQAVTAEVELGKDNVAAVSWATDSKVKSVSFFDCKSLLMSSASYLEENGRSMELSASFSLTVKVDTVD